MMKMKAGVLLLGTALASPAFAADLGTDANTTVTNNFSVTYEVGSSGQQTVTTSIADGNAATFVVDRKVDLTVVEAGGGAGTDKTLTGPGATDVVTSFNVTNKTNDTLDFRLVASNQATGDDGQMSNPEIWIDSDNDGNFDPTLDTQQSYIDNLAEDVTQLVFIVADDAGTLTDGQEANVILQAIASNDGTNAGDDLSNDTGANNLAAVDNVFADPGNDGRESDFDTYRFADAALALDKKQTLLWDPISLASNPKAIPGAVVEYCLEVINSGGADATSVSFTDNLPTGVSFLNTGNRPSPTASENAPFFDVGAASCTTTGTSEDEDATGAGDVGSHSGGTVSADLGDITAGNTEVVRFRAVID
ncbi:MAG: hypothetical protein WA906_05505 [Pacificimonas sp.]